MAAPTNIDAASATALGALPDSIAQQVDDAGTTYTVWFKTPTTVDGMIGVWAFGDLTTYQPSLFIYESDGVTRVVGNNLGTAINKRMQFPSVASTFYYFKVVPNGGNPSPANLTISAEYFTELDPTPVPGSILTNDDTDGMPAIVMDAAGVPRKFIYGIANGESGAILPNGRFVLTQDDETGADNGKAKIYEPDGLSTVAQFTINADTGNSLLLPAGASDTYFYILDTNLSPFILQQVADDGSIVSNVWHITSGGSVKAIAPNRADTILYYATTTVIKRWDLVNNIIMSDLATLGAGFVTEFASLLVLSDGSIVIGANHAAATVSHKVFRYDTSGTLLATYDLTYAGFTLNRIALNVDDTADSVWVWSRNASTGVSRYEEVDITGGGSIITTMDITEYESGVYNSTATATPTGDFGPSLSCPFLIMRAAPAGTIIVTKVNTRHDATTFDFTATNLSPTSFSLADTDSQTYTDVPVGDGYGIAEDPITGWTTTYDVSNDSPVDNISVAEDETVTVTVTNNPPGTIVVVKVNTIVNDETEFDFVATNLTPTSFTLSGIAPDDIATYTDVPAGSGYVITETVPTGWVATYDVSNDSPHTNLVVTPDDTTTVTVTNTFSPPSTGTDEPVRRMRQFTIPSAENFQIFLEKIELEFQRGGGLVTGLGEDPQIMFQLSRDGGKTWGPERWLSAGKLGEYKQRAIWRKLGRARNPVARFIVSDPVFWALQDCYIEAIKGTS